MLKISIKIYFLAKNVVFCILFIAQIKVTNFGDDLIPGKRDIPPTFSSMYVIMVDDLA